MIITDIKPQERSPLRENIYLDGKFGFGISAEARFMAGIKIGQSLDEEQIHELVFADQVGKLFFSAQAFLAVRPRSEKEIRDNLKRKIEKGSYIEPEKIIDKVIEKLGKLDLVSDEEFAKWWIEQRQKFRPKGERVLRAELYAKGVPREIIDQTFYKYEAPKGEIDQIAEKKFGSYKNLPEREFRTKMGSYLARRGYDWDEISSTIENLLKNSE
jgi:regulatory protein